MGLRGFFFGIFFLVCSITAASPLNAGESLPSFSSHFQCDNPASMQYPSDLKSQTEFHHRDFQNQGCALRRNEDQFRNDEFQDRYRQKGLGSWLDGLNQQAASLDRPRLTFAQLFPGLKVGDPFRDPQEWKASGRGRVIPIRFASASGAHLAGDVWLPPASMPGPYPGVIVAPGATQQFRQLYHWAAQGLAEAGYEVMTFDVQAAGESETLSHQPDGSYCLSPGCLTQDAAPYDVDKDGKTFYDGTKDAIRFFFSSPSFPYSAVGSANVAGTDTYNPAWSSLDATRVGIVGHAVGAVVANDLGQEDPRIRSIVKWAYTGFIRAESVPAAHAPTLAIATEYGSDGPTPYQFIPPASAMEFGWKQARTLGLEVMQVALRASTHGEFSYAPGRPASRYGERVAFYYTLAWLDAYVRGINDDALRADAFERLTAKVFDSSSDIHSIGAGTFEPDGSGTYRNRPYVIGGTRTVDRLSFYYRSMYWLKAGGLTCEDMRTC